MEGQKKEADEDDESNPWNSPTTMLLCRVCGTIHAYQQVVQYRVTDLCDKLMLCFGFKVRSETDRIACVTHDTHTHARARVAWPRIWLGCNRGGHHNHPSLRALPQRAAAAAARGH